MPNLFKKITDYDRLVDELEGAKSRLADLTVELDNQRDEIRKITGQLEHAREKVGDERRRRADEEVRRGKVEKQLDKKLEEIEKLKRELKDLRRKTSEPEGIAVLDREASFEQEGVLGFLHETDFDPGQPCITAAIEPADMESYLESIPGMGPWIPRIAKGDRGLFAFISGRKACFLRPPIPISGGITLRNSGFDLAVLDSYLERPLVGFMSVHRDSYAFGILDDKVRESTFEEKYVVGKSKKGGFSQSRYSRSREDQFKHLLNEAGERASRLFLDSDIEYIFVEGDERAVSALTEHQEISENRQFVRFTVPGKIGKNSRGRLPGLIWSWRAWAFLLPGSV